MQGRAVLDPECLPSFPLFSPTVLPLLALGEGWSQRPQEEEFKPPGTRELRDKDTDS